MKHLRLCILAAIFIVRPTDGQSEELTDRVDKLFARWDTKSTPGCALGVVRDGKLVYEKGYGMAVLEHGVCIGSDTIFHIASTSKQFTAIALLLLEQDGKLSLDDDVRKHLPEVPDFGKTITLRHLLHHTSGLRDQWELLKLAGWRSDDVITDDDIYGLVCRQKQLNFDPGSEHLYCNTGYTLAARVVERVSGHPFREFTKQHIFEPLGMKRTEFPADHQSVIPGRAQSYRQRLEGQYIHEVLSYSTVGATCLLTTVADLAEWDNNFYEPRVGDAKLIARMQEVGKLNNGEALNYALGLVSGEYRGLRFVEHGGSDAGFRCTLLRFPEKRLSVILLANAGDCQPTVLARRVADIYLEGELKPASASPAFEKLPEAAVDSKLLAAYVGDYRVLPGVIVTVTREEDRLIGQATGSPKRTLIATSDREFYIAAEDIRITFDKPVQGKCPKILVDYAGNNFTGLRVERPKLNLEQAEEYVGEFRSEELSVIYTVSRQGTVLKVRHPRGVEELRPAAENRFDGGATVGQVTFVRGDGARVVGLRIDSERARQVNFDRVKITSVK
jgi:CubicO group peptidase (beta-lactamase class C family)